MSRRMQQRLGEGKTALVAMAAMLSLMAACNSGTASGASGEGGAPISSDDAAPVAATTEDSASERELAPVTFVQVDASSALWPLYVGIEEDFFSDHGVDVTVVNAGSSSGVAQQIAAGAAQMGGAGIPDLVRAIDAGAPMKLFANGVATSPYSIFASPDVQTWEDLRGSPVVVGGQSDITRFYFAGAAEANGITEDELDYVFAGSTADRFAALVSGSVDAAIVLPPFDSTAREEGYTDLGAVAQYLPDSPFQAWAVDTRWAEDNQDAMAGFARGLRQSLDWLNDPENRQGALEIVAYVTSTTPEDSAAAYDLYVTELEAFPASGTVSIAGLDKMLTTLVSDEFLGEVGDVSRFVDNSYIESAAT